MPISCRASSIGWRGCRRSGRCWRSTVRRCAAAASTSVPAARTCASAATGGSSWSTHRSPSTVPRPTSCSNRSRCAPARTASACCSRAWDDDGRQGWRRCIAAAHAPSSRTRRHARCTACHEPRQRLGAVDQELPLHAIAAAILRAVSSRQRCGHDDRESPVEQGRSAARRAHRAEARHLVPSATGPCPARRGRGDEASTARHWSIRSATTRPVRRARSNRITVQETGFFRHPEQFETFARTLLPNVRAPLQAWSAACANGQEAYSLAMIFNEAGRPGSVLATDVSPAALRRTMAGSYHEREMGGVSAERRRRHFVAVGTAGKPTRSLRRWSPSSATTCSTRSRREVAGVPDRDVPQRADLLQARHAEIFLDRLADAMNRDAYLFVGGAETLWQLTDRFEPVQMGVAYVYRPHPAGRVDVDSAQRTQDRRSNRRTDSRRRGRSDTLAVARRGPARSGVGTNRRDRPSITQSSAANYSPAGSERRRSLRSGNGRTSSPDDPTAHFQLGSRSTPPTHRCRPAGVPRRAWRRSTVRR